MSDRLIDTIQADMVVAMRSRDEKKLSVLRMLKSSMQLTSAEKGRSKELDDEDVLALIRRAVKQREDAAELYDKGNAPDRAAEELSEAEILKAYLPAQMNDSELEELVAAVIKESGATGPKDMGRVMGRVMQESSGKADGKRVKDFVSKLLSAVNVQ